MYLFICAMMVLKKWIVSTKSVFGETSQTSKVEWRKHIIKPFFFGWDSI